MGLMDKVKAGAEQAKGLAEQAAAKAKEEARELQLKRELGQQEAELGRTVVGLVESGELSHPSLEEQLFSINALKAELESLGGSNGKVEDEEPAEGEAPRADVPPAMPS